MRLVRPTGLLGRLARQRKAVATIEFAMSLPFLALLYTGGYQICDAVSANRKVTRAARTIADLTTQYTNVTDADLTTILNASVQVMAPYSTSAAQMTVTEVKVDALLQTSVVWSAGKNGAALNARDPYVLPLALKQPNTYLIVAKINYTYTPIFGATYLGTIPMAETIIMSPRASQQVTKS